MNLLSSTSTPSHNPTTPGSKGGYTIELDYAELGSIKTSRALFDPVIVHEPTEDWALPEDHELYDYITMARLRQNMETPLDERIDYATWPETVAYLSTASMDARYATRQTEELYRYSFRQYLDQWTPLDPGDQPAPLCEDPDLDDYRQDQLDTLRFGIKKDRDQYFIENQYDDLNIDGVPKSFWLTDYEQDNNQETLDEYSQSALDDFH